MGIKTITETNKYIATHEEIEKVEQQLIECLKDNKPFEDIVCPKCGGEVIYTERGNSYIVKCETPNCVSYNVRGI